MTTANPAVSDPTQENSVPPETNPKENDKVAYSTYLKVLDEAKKLKAKLADHETNLNKVKEDQLKEQNQYKALYENANNELVNVKKSLAEQEEAIQNGIKLREFESKLGGKLKKSEYNAFVDFEKIIINPSDKSVDKSSVDLVVSQFLKEHSALVEFANDGKKLPNQAPNAATGTQITYEEWAALAKVNPKEARLRMKDVIKA